MYNWEKITQTNAVITSGDDGEHMVGSLHYTGNAIDLRVLIVPREKQIEAQKFITLALGANFDVILEDDHMHIEYQPKVATPIS